MRCCQRWVLGCSFSGLDLVEFTEAAVGEARALEAHEGPTGAPARGLDGLTGRRGGGPGGGRGAAGGARALEAHERPTGAPARGFDGLTERRAGGPGGGRGVDREERGDRGDDVLEEGHWLEGWVCCRAPGGA